MKYGENESNLTWVGASQEAISLRARETLSVLTYGARLRQPKTELYHRPHEKYIRLR